MSCIFHVDAGNTDVRVVFEYFPEPEQIGCFIVIIQFFENTFSEFIDNSDNIDSFHFLILPGQAFGYVTHQIEV